MAVFGQQEYGSPLGAIAPSKVFNASGYGHYDYSGFSSRSGASGFSGFSMAASTPQCHLGPGIELLPWKPTLIFPLNYDVLVGEIQMLWREAIPMDSCGDDVTYEIQYTNTFSRNNGWRTVIKDIPSGNEVIPLDFSNVPYTDDGGLRIRARDVNGIYSDWSSNLKPFTVANHVPNAVELIYPVSGDIFDETLTVIWKEPDVGDVDGHSVTYKVQVTMDFASDSGWITVPEGDAIPRGITSINVNSFEFPEGYNFGVRVVPVDVFGAEGTPAKTDFRIRHTGNFLIDTIPPTGTAIINDGSTLVADPRVKIDVFATDLTSGIKDMRFKNEGEDWGDWDTYVTQKFWDLSEGDGTKRVFVQFRDCAGNISEACDCEVISRVMCRTGNITDLQSGSTRLYSSYDRDGRIVEYAYLPIDLTPTPVSMVMALAFYKEDLYAACYDEDADQTTVYRMRGNALSVLVVSGKIMSMTSYGTSLYAAFDEGYIKDLFGTERYPAIGDPPLPSVTKLKTDGSVLFATAGQYYVTYNGVDWEQRQV
jgi:hypothetical protein